MREAKTGKESATGMGPRGGSRFFQWASRVERLVCCHPTAGFWVGILAAAALGIGLASVGLNYSLTIDEPFTANVVHLPLSEMRGHFSHDFIPAYYIALKGWVSVFGESEASLRSLSVLAFGLGILVVGLSGRMVAGPWGEIAAAFLFSVSRIGLRYAGTARLYAMLGLMISIAGLLFMTRMRPYFEAQERQDDGRVTPYLFLILVNAIGLFTHPTANGGSVFGQTVAGS